MGILGTLYNGVSGVMRMSDNMNILADNIANNNTTSFKASRLTFEEIMNSAIDTSQMGDGVNRNSIDRNFNQGSFEATSEATDMAIAGEGFFMLRNEAESATSLYSRDGGFKLIEHAGAEEDAFNLVNSAGYFVQGINLNSVESPSGSIGDILVKNKSLPLATRNVEIVANLKYDSLALEETSSTLYANWDGRNLTDGEPDPIADSAYDYKTALNIYDTEGDEYELCAYFDHTTEMDRQEFLLTCNPKLDRRVYDAAGSRYNDTATTTNKGAGALLYGIVSFNVNGDFTDMECWNVPFDGNVDHTQSTNQITLERGDGYFDFLYEFTGAGDNQTAELSFGTTPAAQVITSPRGASATDPVLGVTFITTATTWDSVYDLSGNQVAAGDVITFTGLQGDGTAVSYAYAVDLTEDVQDLLDNLETQFGCTAAITGGKVELTDTEIGESQFAVTAITYADSSGNDPAANTSLAQVFGDEDSIFAIENQDRFARNAISTTGYASPYVTIMQTQDGYPEGYLREISVDQEGVLSGLYTNFQQLEQAQVSLAKFVNLEGLVKQGGNLYVASDDAGTISTGTPGQNGFGNIVGNALEMSNVDLGREFANLIVTQRAFQANSKTISTADDIYNTLIRMKR